MRLRVRKFPVFREEPEGLSMSRISKDLRSLRLPLLRLRALRDLTQAVDDEAFKSFRRFLNNPEKLDEPAVVEKDVF